MITDGNDGHVGKERVIDRIKRLEKERRSELMAIEGKGGKSLLVQIFSYRQLDTVRGGTVPLLLCWIWGWGLGFGVRVSQPHDKIGTRCIEMHLRPDSILGLRGK